MASGKVRIALCNAVLGHLDFAAQCAYAAALGYDGLEVVPHTLDATPQSLTAARCATFRRAAADAGIAITGLHRLMSAVPHLSIVASDANVHRATVEFLQRMVDVCADLGGSVIVHGSPQQRSLPPGMARTEGWGRARDAFAAIAAHAHGTGITYCVEPLPGDETNFINTLDEAAAMVDAVGSAHLKTMIDAKSVLLAETLSLPQAIDRWLPTGKIAHVQLNDRNRRGPGQGDERFGPVLSALARNGYTGVITVEPFVFVPDAVGTAAWSIGYLRGLLEALDDDARRPAQAPASADTKVHTR